MSSSSVKIGNTFPQADEWWQGYHCGYYHPESENPYEFQTEKLRQWNLGYQTGLDHWHRDNPNPWRGVLP